MTCDRCDECRKKKYNFCKFCGEPLHQEKKVIPVFAAIVTVFVAFILLFELITGWVKLPYLMDNASDAYVNLYYLAPIPEKLIEVSGTGLQILYILELVIVTVSVGLCVRTLIRKFREKGMEIESVTDNALTENGSLNGLMFAFQMVLLIICTMMGIDMSAGDLGPTYQQMFSLMNASVYEEFLCRIVALGLPIMIVSLILKKKETPFWRYLLGGFRFEKWMIIFVIFSALLFALGHLGGWGTWKVIPTFVFGLVTAYLFMKYGIYATITFHFLTDFMLAEEWLLGSAGVVTLSVLALAFFSLPTVVIYGKKVKGFVKDFIKTEAQ